MNEFDWQPCGDNYFVYAFTEDTLPYEGTGAAECVPGDTGGWTKYGICELDGFTPDQIKALTLEQAREFYRVHYWNVLGCSQMPAALAREIFDWGVNHGVGAAMLLLQQLIYSGQHDGRWGVKTLNDLKYYLTKHTVGELVQKYAQYREQCYEHWGIGSQAKFREGWLRRNENLAAKLGVRVLR